MIKLALELPTGLLGEFAWQTDLDFVLAHKVLEDKAYAEHFRVRHAHRELILDNSMHELGHSLKPLELMEAALLVRADYVVAPDRLGEPEWTLEQYLSTLKAFAGMFTKVVPVLCGRSPEERMRFAAATAGAPLLCLPYREPRLAWFHETAERSWITPIQNRIHLLGVSTLEELAEWSVVAKKTAFRFSVDTSKPVKAGLLGIRINDQHANLRGLPISSKDLLNLEKFTDGQVRLIHNNVAFFRSLL